VGLQSSAINKKKSSNGRAACITPGIFFAREADFVFWRPSGENLAISSRREAMMCHFASHFEKFAV
jgi:hypothetical protein